MGPVATDCSYCNPRPRQNTDNASFARSRDTRDSVTMETMPWYVRFTVAQQRSESENPVTV